MTTETQEAPPVQDVTAEVTGPQVFQTSFTEGELDRPTDVPLSFYKKAREMRQDPTIKLVRALSIAPMVSAKWSYEQEDTAPYGAQQLISKMFAPLRNQLLRSAFFGCFDFGWAPFEKVFEIKPADGRCHVKKLKPLLHDITEILVDENNGDHIGLRQEPRGTETEPLDLGSEKYLLLNIDVEGSNWYGIPTMLAMSKVYDQWNESNESSARYDRKLAGSHWVIHYPLGTSKYNGQNIDNFEIAKRIIAKLEASGAVAVPRTIAQHVDDLNAQAPDQWKIELLSDTAGQTSFLDRMRYLDALKARAAELPERAVLEGQFGTKAEAEAHADISIQNMELRHAIICQLINEQLVNQILEYNYGPEAINSVYIQPAPIADLEREWLKTLYMKILEDPNGFLTEYDGIDTEALRDRLSIPNKPFVNVDLGFTGEAAAGTDGLEPEPDLWPTLSDPTLSPSMEPEMLSSGPT